MTGRYFCRWYQCSFIHKTVFWDFSFWPRYLRKRLLCPWNQPHVLRNSDKSLLSLEQNKLKELRDWFCRRKRALDNNAKINLSPNIPFTFLLFEAIAFLQIFFPRKNQFVSFIELKMQRLINYWANTSKFKIDKITYSKSYDVSKNKPLLYP